MFCCCSSRSPANAYKCAFIACETLFGGEMSALDGPVGSVSSSHFIFCSSSRGRGYYHNFNKAPLALSNSFFMHNTASFTGGFHVGGFVDWRGSSYTSIYSFLFFHAICTPLGTGNDISIQSRSLEERAFKHCFPTTPSTSFFNVESY